MLETLDIMEKKRVPLPKHYPQPFAKLTKFSWPSLSGRQKWMTSVHQLSVNKLILIYFTWFVYTFVDYKYNVLLKRDDECLMPLNTFVTLTF